MVIRFQCGACDQPIEIDDEWGGKAVGCPYCRKTITAPEESTFEESSVIPLASPASGSGGADSVEAVSESASGAVAVSSGGNPLAVVAAVTAAAALACLIWMQLTISFHETELRQLEELAGGRGIAGSQSAIREMYKDSGGLPPSWMFGMLVAALGTFVCCLVSVICGAIGLRFRRRRNLAVASVVVSGGILLMSCALMALGVMASS